jgi:hypothetical protein
MQMTRTMLLSTTIELACPRCSTRQLLTLRWYGNAEQAAAVGQSVPHDCPAPDFDPTHVEFEW